MQLTVGVNIKTGTCLVTIPLKFPFLWRGVKLHWFATLGFFKAFMNALVNANGFSGYW